MKKKDVIDHFGSIKKAADALGIWPQAVYSWGENVPDTMAYKVEVITGGKLKAVSDDNRNSTK